ncbi:MAG: ABC transporter permease [Promethearchaeota archaeon]
MTKTISDLTGKKENVYFMPETEVLDKKKNPIASIVKNVLNNSYLHFVLKKLAFYVLLVFIAVSLAFLIPRLLPGDPLASIFKPPIGATPEQLEQWYAERAELRRYLGLDKPLLEQYISFWIDFLQFNFGESFSWHFAPVSEVVFIYLPYTLILVIPAIIVTFYLGNWIGAHIGFKKKKTNTFAYYLFIFLQSAPYFWVCLIFFDIFILKYRIVPYNPTPDLSLDPKVILALLKQYWLPFLTLIICFTGGWATGMRSMTIYELDSDYILFCKKLGFRDRRLRRYAKRNAILPQFTGLNLRFNELVGATLIVEWIFLWPGLGSLTYKAFLSYDYPLIIGTFIITILIIAIGNFIIDITYGFLDPRIKTGGKEG